MTPASALLTPVLLALATLAGAAEPPPQITQITWLSADPPPSMGNTKPGTGLAGRLVGFMVQQWPEVKHEIVPANAKRSWQLLAQGEQVCHASSLRTPERERVAYFTNTQLGPPLQLVVRRDKLAALPRNAANEVDMGRLLADSRLRGAMVAGRSYGAFVDAMLTARSTTKTVVFYAAADYGSKILPMLAVGRADYTVEQDMALSVGRAANPRLDELQSLPIQGASEPIHAGVACPRTAWGLAAIREIDKRLGTPTGAEMLRESFGRWITPEVRLRYGAKVDVFYKERAKPSVIR